MPEKDHTTIPLNEISQAKNMLSWCDVGFSVQVKKQSKSLLLQNYGVAYSGEVVAIMGGRFLNLIYSGRKRSWQEYASQLSFRTSWAWQIRWRNTLQRIKS